MMYMERCGARRSFEKPRVEPPPACLQVIGFDVSPNMKSAEAAAGEGLDNMVSSATASSNELSPSFSKPASSPRSALQQLLHHHSLPSSSPTSSNQQLPPLLPSFSSSNQNLTSGLLQPAPPVEAYQKWMGGISRPQSPTLAAAYQSNSSSGHLKSLLQSECTNSDIPANQNFGNSFFSSLSQSQYTCSSLSSAGNQLINQHNAKPSCKALIKENYEAFFQSKPTHGDGNDAKAHEVEVRSIHAKKVINDQLPQAAKSRKSWLHDDDDDNNNNNDDHPSAAEKCKKGSWKGLQQIIEVSLGTQKSRKSSRSEEESKKSSLFMFVASSPAAEFHHHHHQAEHNASTSMGFLSSCHLCRRHLGEGQDVFMYSGDKAFCSMECRYQQIVIDERKERCPPQIIRSGASPVFHRPSVTTPNSTHHPIMINKPHFINTAAVA